MIYMYIQMYVKKNQAKSIELENMQWLLHVWILNVRNVQNNLCVSLRESFKYERAISKKKLDFEVMSFYTWSKSHSRQETVSSLLRKLGRPSFGSYLIIPLGASHKKKYTFPFICHIFYLFSGDQLCIRFSGYNYRCGQKRHASIKTSPFSLFVSSSFSILFIILSETCLILNSLRERERERERERGIGR